MRRIVVAVALTAAVGTSANAQTADAVADPVNRADLQCLAVMAAGVGTQEDGSEAQMGLIGGMGYYLGRLEGRAPRVVWLEQLGDYLEGDFEAEFKAQSQRCGEEMIAFGAGLTAWGERMQALAAKKDDPKAQARRP